MNIINRLKEIRKEKNLSQQELSEMILVSQNTVSQYESNKRTVNNEMLESIADALGYEVTLKKKGEKSFSIKRLTHLELIDLMNQEILKQTGVFMDFKFELCSDGNLDLFSNHTFSREELDILAKLGWIDEDRFEDCDEIYGLFFEVDELDTPNNLFWFILEKTFKEGVEVCGVEDYDDFVELTISIPN